MSFRCYSAISASTQSNSFTQLFRQKLVKKFVLLTNIKKSKGNKKVETLFPQRNFMIVHLKLVLDFQPCRLFMKFVIAN